MTVTTITAALTEARCNSNLIVKLKSTSSNRWTFYLCFFFGRLLEFNQEFWFELNRDYKMWTPCLVNRFIFRWTETQNRVFQKKLKHLYRALPYYIVTNHTTFLQCHQMMDHLGTLQDHQLYLVCVWVCVCVCMCVCLGSVCFCLCICVCVGY